MRGIRNKSKGGLSRIHTFLKWSKQQLHNLTQQKRVTQAHTKLKLAKCNKRKENFKDMKIKSARYEKLTSQVYVCTSNPFM